MIKDATSRIKQAQEILDEIEVYESYKKHLLEQISSLAKDYKSKKLGYLDYQQKLEIHLKGKTIQEWETYYDSYTYSLLKKIELIISELYVLATEDIDNKAQANTEAPEQKEKYRTKQKNDEVNTEAPEQKEKYQKQKIRFYEPDQQIDERMNAIRAKLSSPLKQRRASEFVFEKKPMPDARIDNVTPEHAHIQESGIGTILRHLRESLQSVVEYISHLQSQLFSRKEKRISKEKRFSLSSIPRGAGRGIMFFAKLPIKTTLAIGKLFASKPNEKGINFNIFSKPKKTVFVEELATIEKQTETKKIEKTKGIFSGGILSPKLLNDLLSRFRKKEDRVLGETTEVPTHLKKLREMRERFKENERNYGFEQTLLAKEAKKVKQLIETEKEPYKGSGLGAMANIFVKKTSVSLVNTFPELFEQLYNALRSANVKILSNTYVSIMVFLSISIFIAVTASLSVVFFILNYPLYEVIMRSFFFGFIASAATAIFLYSYPFMKISERRKNITANMPFAINHLSAVSASGVPPAAMLQLISDSTEYGEIAVELRKIVDLMEVFGYDLITAIRTVSAITPSPAFKEVLDGMVSTIETGGDLESYLREKAEEATLTYKLERQRYNESIATYSDIYTGLLIAAPLFFVAALAIINLLGGTIGGFGIEAILAFGAYIAIPLLNIAFLIFLQMNQPEV